MRRGMEEAAREAQELQQQAESKKQETEDKQEKQKLDKIINETKRLQKHIEKALEIAQPNPPRDQGEGEPPALENINAEPHVPDPPRDRGEGEPPALENVNAEPNVPDPPRDRGEGEPPALENVNAEPHVPDPPRDRGEREPPKEIEVLKLQQEIYKELKETENKCKLNLREENEPRNEENEPHNEENEPHNEENIKDFMMEVKKIQDDMWNEYYMKIACLVALRSKDPSTPVS